MNYILSRTVSKLLRIIGKLFAVYAERCFSNALVRGESLYSWLQKMASKDYPDIVLWYSRR